MKPVGLEYPDDYTQALVMESLKPLMQLSSFVTG